MFEVPSSTWPVIPLGILAADEDGSIAIGPFGSSLKAEVYTAVGIPVIRGNNLKDRPGFQGEFVHIDEKTAAKFPRCIVRPGDLVFPHRGAIGEVGLAIGPDENRWMLSTSMMKFRPHGAKLDAQYLYYFFRSPMGRHQLLRNASQVGTPGIGQPLASLRTCNIPLPPLPEQRAIAGVLGSLDDKIASNRLASRTLERLARAIFRAWFVDFEAVKVKAAGAHFFPGMPHEVFDAFPSGFVQSEIGIMPKGWAIGTIADIATLSRATVNPQAHAEEMYEHLSIPAFDNSKRPVIELGESIKSNKLAVVSDCMLVSKLNPRIPRVWLPPKPDRLRQIASTEFLVTVPKSDWHLSYLFCLVHQPEFTEDMAQRASGTSNSHQRVKPEDYLSTRAVLPPQPLRESFEVIVRPMLELSQAVYLNNGKLAALRDYLLPKLLSGEVRVVGPERTHL